MTDPKHYRKHILSLLVENHQGVLAKIASLIAAKGYNIDSLSVAETLDPSISRMTLAVDGDEWVIEQAVKQFHRLIDVIKVTDLTDEEHIGREMVFVRVMPSRRIEARSCGSTRSSAADRGRDPGELHDRDYRGREEIGAFLELLQPFGIQEIVRSGTLAIARGSKSPPKREESRMRVASRKPVATD